MHDEYDERYDLLVFVVYLMLRVVVAVLSYHVGLMNQLQIRMMIR